MPPRRGPAKDLLDDIERQADQEEEEDHGPPKTQPKELARAWLAAPYKGWWFDFDENYTMEQFEMLTSNMLIKTRDALVQIIDGWNILDKSGNPIEITHNASEFNKVGRKLLSAMAVAIFEETTVPEA